MARALVIGLLLVITALVEVSLLPVLTVSGFTPDLLLLLVIAFALDDGALTGVRVALPAGLLTDLLSSTTPLGLSALVYLGVAYAVGAARPYLAPESLTAPTLFAGAGTFLGVGGYGILSALLARASASALLVAEAALVATVYAILLAPGAFALTRYVDRHFPVEVPSTSG
jgi:rod shape-determining protein MreD